MREVRCGAVASICFHVMVWRADGYLLFLLAGRVPVTIFSKD